MQILILLTARMKINQIPYVIFQATSQESLRVMTHNSSEVF